MLLQKTFHVHQTPEETAIRFADWDARDFAALRRASVNDEGGGRFEFIGGHGFRGYCELQQLPTEEPGQILFRSTSGNFEVSGLIEFVQVREQLTEVQVTLEYTIHSAFYRTLDALSGSMDRFVNQQLEILQMNCEGGRRTESACRYATTLIFPATAQLAN